MEKSPHTEKKWLAKYISMLLAIVIGTTLVVVTWTSIHAMRSKPAGPSEEMARINQKAAKLVGPGPIEHPTLAKINATRTAIESGQFATAEKIVNEEFRGSSLGDWSFGPFSGFISSIPVPGNARFHGRLNAWVAQDSRSATPYLLRAEYEIQTGWRVRSGRFADKIQPKHLRTFDEDMKKALADITQAMHLDKHDPYSRYLWLDILNTQGDSSALQVAFRKAIAQFPSYYPLYSIRLTSLEPKWGGTTAQMYALVHKYAGISAADSPMRMLYLQLYADLLDAVAVRCSDASGDALNACMTQGMNTLVTDKLERRAYAVLKMYNNVDKYSFSLEMGDILNEMVTERGGQRYAGAFLQLAAQVTGTNNELSATNTRTNNYMVDRLTGFVWYRSGQFDNARKMFERALTDLPHMQFGGTVNRNYARADLYDLIGDSYNRQGQDEKVVVYKKAAEALGGIERGGEGDPECASLLKLGFVKAAIKSCTALINHGGNVQAMYWRARAYERAENFPAALADFRRVADTASSFNSSAAIRLSYIYCQRHHYKKGRDALLSYRYLYNTTYDDNNGVAVAYNNLCYADMHLHQLHAALKACTDSLKYETLPDALAKQRKIVKRLEAEHTQHGGRASGGKPEGAANK